MAHGSHQDGETGHIDEHNYLDNKIAEIEESIEAVTSGVPDATAEEKGRVQLTNDLGGSAGAPEVVKTTLTQPLPVNQGGTGSSTKDWVDLTNAQTVNGIKTFSFSPLVPTPSASGQATNKQYVDETVAAGVADADATTKGKVKLTNHLSGTADAPTVVGTELASPLPIDQGGTGGSTKDWVDLTNAQTVNGIKTFTDSPVVPSPSASGDAANKEYVDTAGGSAAVATHVNEYHPFDFRRYGAVGNGSTDNTSAMQAAIADVAATETPGMYLQDSSGTYQGGDPANGAGGIYIPPGTFVVGPVVLEHRTQIWSDSWGGVLLRKAGTSGTWFQNRRDSSVHAGYCRFVGLTLNGNAANVSTGNAILWVGDQTFTYDDPKDEDYDIHCEVVNCQIINVKGDAIRMEGSGENKIVNNFIRSVSGIGIYAGQDNWIISNSVGHTGKQGIYVAGDDCRVNDNKVWYTGEVTPSDGQGFYIAADSGVGAGNSSQDTKAQGVLFDNAYGWAWQSMIDSASKDSSGTYAGLDVYNSQYNNINVTVRNRYRNDATTGPITDAVNHAGGSDNNTVIAVAAKGVWGVDNELKSGSVVNDSYILINGVLQSD